MVEKLRCQPNCEGCYIMASLPALGVPAAIVEATKDAILEGWSLATALHLLGFEPLRALKMAEALYVAHAQHPELCRICGEAFRCAHAELTTGEYTRTRRGEIRSGDKNDLLRSLFRKVLAGDLP